MSLKLDDVALIGRTFTEYLEIFDLNEDELYNKKILDIAGGVSSFCAEANLKEIDVIAMDKIYSFDVKKLKDKSQSDLVKVSNSLKDVKEMYKWSFYKDIDKWIEYRKMARNLFLYDYESNIEHYQITNLPKINFRNNSFDLALISHLLFVYDEMLDYKFHKETILQALRVAKEVRVFPFINLNGKKSKFIEDILNDESFKGFKIEILKVNFEFIKGGNEVMIIKKL